MTERRHEVTRIEGFSDAVFGFALTLLVVSLEVPTKFDDLLNLMKGAVPFGLMFAMVCYIWWEHNKFFRRYGLQDAWTAFLNSFLLFVVLFYVYPLKFLTTHVLGPVFRMKGDVSMDDGSGRLVMLLYSAGVVLIFSTFVMLYQHAWRQRGKLELTARESTLLRFGRRAHMYSALLGVLSIGLSLILPERLIWIAGVVYSLMGPVHGWNGFRMGASLNKDNPPSAQGPGPKAQ